MLENQVTFFAKNLFFRGFETRGRAQGVAIRPLALPRTLMTYPDERSES